jgi:hypothetical protein
MKFEEFKKEMSGAKTYDESHRVIAKLTSNQLKELVQVFEKFEEISGLTMRDEFILSTAKVFLENPEWKQKYIKDIEIEKCKVFNKAKLSKEEIREIKNDIKEKKEDEEAFQEGYESGRGE